MEKLALKYDTLLKAYATLDEIIDLFTTTKKEQHNEVLLLALQDSVIKRFEFCYDLTWKYLKKYLHVKHGITVKSPKTTFQESLNQGITSQEETAHLFTMVIDRNTTSHEYDIQAAREISERVMLYAQLFNTIAERVKP